MDMEAKDGFSALEVIEDLVVKLMGHAVMARAYQDEMRRNPALRAGFSQLQDKHRSAVMTLSDDIKRAAAPLAATRVGPALSVVGRPTKAG